jgi:hypothetical protein
MCLADGRLAMRRDEIVNFLDLVSDIPEPKGNVNSWAFMPPIILSRIIS